MEGFELRDNSAISKQLVMRRLIMSRKETPHNVLLIIQIGLQPLMARNSFVCFCLMVIRPIISYLLRPLTAGVLLLSGVLFPSAEIELRFSGHNKNVRWPKQIEWRM